MPKRLLPLVLTLASLCGLLPAQAPQAPDTPAGRQFAHWLEVFNRGQRDEIEKFLKENDPEARIDNQMEFRRTTGGFDLKKVDESTPNRLTGIVKEARFRQPRPLHPGGRSRPSAPVQGIRPPAHPPIVRLSRPGPVE